MIARFLAPLLTATVGLFGQIGIFGPVTTRPQSGDLAPGLTFTKVLSGPPATSWTPSRLFGQVTVLTFFPNTSHNLQLVMQWNGQVGQFAGKPVQFVWITGEEESSLLPWLMEHPLKGFMLLDPDGSTARSYGIERPVAVIIGADGRIVGFDLGLVPSADTVNAALEGRITTTPLNPGAAEFKAFVESHKVLLDAEAPRMGIAGDEHRPNFPPSYTLHVSRTQINGSRDSGGDDFLSLQGFDVKGVVSRLYDINRIRIELPASFRDGEAYEFSMVLPEKESTEQIIGRFRQGLQDYFHLTATHEVRLMDVYVVTASDRKPPAVEKPEVEGGGFKHSSIGYQVPKAAGDPYDAAARPKAFSISAIASISAEGTADEFCRTLERVLDRPVINETNLQGEFAFHIGPSETEKNDFLTRLHDQLGLVIATAQRNVEILVFNPR